MAEERERLAAERTAIHVAKHGNVKKCVKCAKAAPKSCDCCGWCCEAPGCQKHAAAKAKRIKEAAAKLTTHYPIQRP